MDARKLEALALMLAEERLARQAAERTAAELDKRLGEMAKLDAELALIKSTEREVLEARRAARAAHPLNRGDKT